MNLSIITANLPGLKSLLYDLQTGQSGLQLGEHAARWEIASQQALSDSIVATGGSGDQQRSSGHHVERLQRGRPEMSDVSQRGILRTVDIAVSVESREQRDVEKLAA